MAAACGLPWGNVMHTKELDMAIVRALMAEGHGAAKAFEIELDYRRGDAWARRWVDMVLKLQADHNIHIARALMAAASQ
jgi:hypothetical protein